MREKGLIDMLPKFVLAWITSTMESSLSIQSGGHVVFVKHPKRGWEIPGGHLNADETPEEALHREVREETGLEIKILAWNKEYYPDGWVAHAETKSKPNSDIWNVADSNVEQVAWWSRVPPTVTWTEQEFIDLDDWTCTVRQE